MTDIPFILADIVDREQLGSLFLILFWGFLIASLVWFLIWLLLGAIEENGGEVDSSSKTSGSAEGSSGAGTARGNSANAAAAASVSTSAASSEAKAQAAADAKAAKEAAAATEAKIAADAQAAKDAAASVEAKTAADAKAVKDAAAEAEAKAAADAKAAKTAAAASVAAAANLEKDDFSKLGLAGGTAQVLNAEGTLQYGQIADWSEADVSAAAAKFGESNPGIEFAELPWKAHALANGVDLNKVSADDPAYGAPHKAAASVDHDGVIASSFSGQDVRNDADLGVVYNGGAVAAHVDDLQAIKGVGPKLSNELNKYGVFCYKQIANWSDHNVSEFSERLNCFKNRIERDRWIPQATTMECSDLPGIDTATADEAASAFADEIASGKAKIDDTHGVIYTSAPDDEDDLKKIKGIAKVLEGKLHGIGVYKYKQIAVWTDAACKEFSKLLTFKDRIYRDDWISQAKAFHEEKYNEKL